MSSKKQPQEVFKTESQLKEEAAVKHAAEAEAAAKLHKTEFQKKRENYWYHYKWHTIAGIVGIFLLVFFIKDMFFRTKPDATIVVVNSSYITAEALEGLSAALQEHTTDLNGDGKIIIATDYIALPKLDDGSEQGADATYTPDLTGGQQDMGYAMKLMAVIAAGSDPIYLLDEDAHAYLTAIGQGDDPNSAYDIFEKFIVPVNATTLDFEGAAQLDDMAFYLRVDFGDESYYEYCKQLLQAIAGK